MASPREIAFQNDIIAAMTLNGWLTGPASGYDPASALYTEDFLGYYKEAWPREWEKFARANPHQPEDVLVRQLVRALERSGTLHVLRHGFKLVGAEGHACSFAPDHGMNPDTLARYQANRLRVVAEVSYSPHARTGANKYNPRLDLVLFVNGLPTATLELKSEFQQSIELAKRQYRNDRPPKDPLTRKPEPLLTFKRGALVHFAVSQSEVAMTTRLNGPDTFFLPFNLGTEDGGAGNPKPASDTQYATGYLWQRLFEPDAWLKNLSRFLHLDTQTEEHFDGTRTTRETMIFPRYHQWEVVNKLLDATRREGPGKLYLIQHSAGSGKSNSIAWTAHQLASLYDDAGQRLFNSVIVITDRTVLDDQLQKTISQFEHTAGVIDAINRDTSSKSKSEQLAEALRSQKRIIIVTIQTFPALYEALNKYPALASGRYAVIADEAHSSQTGSSASKLKQILGSDAPDADFLNGDPNNEHLSAEDMIDAAVLARQPGDRISYYAFTATPKAKTIELFGRLPDPSLPPSDTNKPEAFHLYSMRQAIEEGFILDVLQNYTTYQTAWRIAGGEEGKEDTEVDSKKARQKLARWVRMHPYNIGQRVQIIVEHFRANVRHLLGGQAKAMVVTSSRQEAVRYQLAMREYIREKGYLDVHPLVAFSGSLPPDDAIPEEVTENSSLLNPGLNGRDLAKAFDTQDFNVMIAANKYQTGFDQPKLCAMYVDKKLQGVDCVQTLSRLNRTFGDSKQTFILDFFNDAADILEAFKPYYNKAELSDVTDPMQIHDLQRQLDDEQIYSWHEVRAFAQAFFDPGKKDGDNSKLNYYCHSARQRFFERREAAEQAQQQAMAAKKTAQTHGDTVGLNRAEQDLKEAGEQIDALDIFRKRLQSFVRLYEFVSHIVPYNDSDLEKLCVFARYLYPLLRLDRLAAEEVDVGELRLTHYRLNKQAEHRLRLSDQEGDATLKPSSDVGTGKAHDPEKKLLAEIIEALNELFGADTHDEDQLHLATGFAKRVRREDDVMAQVKNHTDEQIMYGLFPKRLDDIMLDAMKDNEKMVVEILSSEEKKAAFAHIVLKLLRSEATLERATTIEP